MPAASAPAAGDRRRASIPFARQAELTRELGCRDALERDPVRPHSQPESALGPHDTEHRATRSTARGRRAHRRRADAAAARPTDQPVPQRQRLPHRRRPSHPRCHPGASSRVTSPTSTAASTSRVVPGHITHDQQVGTRERVAQRGLAGVRRAEQDDVADRRPPRGTPTARRLLHEIVAPVSQQGRSTRRPADLPRSRQLVEIQPGLEQRQPVLDRTARRRRRPRRGLPPTRRSRISELVGDRPRE